MSDALDLTIVVPCLNEVGTVGAVVEKGLRSLQRLGLTGEVLVSDNGSTDGSVELARSLGARVVHAPQRGYGNALRHGMAQARGRMLVMGDADDTYNFEEIAPFIEKMKAGVDFVMGTRLPPGRMMPGANPWLHRWVGTPLLTYVVNRLFRLKIHDVNCGMRGLTKATFDRLQLTSGGMEFASEMVIKAGLLGVTMAEVPVTLYPDRRRKPPHLRRWRDGWRHLEFMLLHAPDQLLFLPGLAALLLGLLLIVPVSFGPQYFLGRLFDFHYLFYGGTLALAGLQSVMASLLIRNMVGGVIVRPNATATAIARWVTFGRGLAIGGVMIASGVVLEAIVLGVWIHSNFGPLDEPRRSVLGMLLIAAGIQTVLFSFVQGLLKRHAAARAGSFAPGQAPA